MLVVICFSTFCAQKLQKGEKARKTRNLMQNVAKKNLTSVMVQTRENSFLRNFAANFLLFLPFYQIFAQKQWKSILQQAFGVRSTQTLVNIYNTGIGFVFFVEPQPNHPRHQTRSMPARTERRIQCHRPCQDQQVVQLQGNLCWNCQPSSSTCTQANWRTLQWYTCVSLPTQIKS